MRSLYDIMSTLVPYTPVSPPEQRGKGFSVTPIRKVWAESNDGAQKIWRNTVTGELTDVNPY
jgi:hypothetical protein